MSYLDQQFNLRDIIADLPPDVQRAIGEIDVASEVWRIGGQFELLISEIGDVCEETAKVIVGETRPENFIDNVRAKLGDENKNKATAVATEINNKILIPIREAFKRISMGNLVPDSNAEREALSVERSEAEKVSSPDVTSYKLQDTSLPSDRDFIMHEIENPTPAGVSTVSYGQPAQQMKRVGPFSTQEIPPPINLPTESEPEREIPVIRTMPRDVANQTNNPQQTTYTTYNQPVRGKFGHGTPPTIGRRPDQLSEIPGSKPQIPKSPENQNNQTAQKVEPIGIDQLNAKRSTLNAPSFIPSKPGMVGGTLRGNPSQQPARRTFTPPAPKPQEPSREVRPLATPPLSPPPQPPLDATSYKPPQVVEQSPLRGGATLPTEQSFGQASSPEAPVKPAAPPTPQRTTFTIPQKTDQVDDVIEDKLTKTVSVPSERKRYVVDPYREPLE